MLSEPWRESPGPGCFSNIIMSLTSSLTTFAKREEVLAGPQEDHPSRRERTGQRKHSAAFISSPVDRRKPGVFLSKGLERF